MHAPGNREQRRKIGDGEGAAGSQGDDCAQNGGVAHICLLGMKSLRRARWRTGRAPPGSIDQSAEDRVAIEARPASPDHASLPVDQRRQGAISNDRQIERGFASQVSPLCLARRAPVREARGSRGLKRRPLASRPHCGKLRVATVEETPDHASRFAPPSIFISREHAIYRLRRKASGGLTVALSPSGRIALTSTRSGARGGMEPTEHKADL